MGLGFVLVVALALSSLAGCVQYSPLDRPYSGPAPLPAKLAARYAYDPPVLHPASTEIEARRTFVVRAVRLAPVEPDGTADTLAKTIRFDYYDVQSETPAPVVLVLPILNGNLHVTRYFARYFAEQGFAALLMDRDREPIPVALQHVEQTMRRNLLDYRRVLDWIATRPELDSRRIGVFGISFGGIDAVVLAALDDRVDAVVAGMAGGDLPYLFVNTSYRSVARQVAREVHRNGLSRDSLEKRLSAEIVTDPMSLAPYVDARDLLMIMTRSDWIIPFEAQQRLRRRLGGPATMVLPTGHRTSVVYFPLLRSSASEFFAKRFSRSDEPAASAAPAAPTGAPASAAAAAPGVLGRPR